MPSPRRAPQPCRNRTRVQTYFSPVNKKGPPAAHKNTPSKAPSDAFCVVLFIALVPFALQ
ncbi:hypothetical protein FQ029_16305 [Escherichia coli]|nr:hypothetical protein [Escherichia coli]